MGSSFAKAGRGPRVSDRVVRSTVAPGARGRRNAARATRRCPLKRIWRLEPPGPPVSLVRGASPGRRGEVQASKRCWERTRRECSWSKVVGSRSRSNASGSCSAYCRKAGRRRASQPVADCPSADTEGRRSSLNRRSSEGRWRLRAARRVAQPQRYRGKTGTRAKRCAGVMLERNRDSTTNGSVRRREASGAHG
jgi:hypothetical protein